MTDLNLLGLPELAVGLARPFLMNALERSCGAVLVLCLALVPVSAKSLAQAQDLAPDPASALPDQPRDHVVDLAGVMDSGVREEIIRVLQEVIVLTVRSLGGRSEQEFAHETATRWKLGQKGRDNGLLILLATEDRKVRMEVGYGLEGVLPDGKVGRILDEQFMPAARSGDYSAGLRQTALAVAWEVAASQGVTLTGVPAPGSGSGATLSGLLSLGLVLAFLFAPWVIVLLLRRWVRGTWGWTTPRGSRTWVPNSRDYVSSRSGGYGGFGGFGGGGSFGGGGGGSFGGGGASRSW